MPIEARKYRLAQVVRTAGGGLHVSEHLNTPARRPCPSSLDFRCAIVTNEPSVSSRLPSQMTPSARCCWPWRQALI